MNNKIIRIFSLIIFVGFLIFLQSNLTINYGKAIHTFDQHAEWKFVHEKLIDPKDASQYFSKGEVIQLPHKFIDHFNTAETYGTYITKIKLPPNYTNKKLGVFIPFQYGSYNLYMNNELVIENGTVSPFKEYNEIDVSPKVGQVIPTSDEIYIVLQLSNFSSIRGGFTKEIQLDEYDVIMSKHYTALLCYAFIVGFFFILGIILIRIAFVTKEGPITFLLAGICLTFAIRSIFSRPFYYALTPFDISWVMAVKIEAFFTGIGLLLFIKLCSTILAPYIKNRYLIAAYCIVGLQMGIIIFTSPLIFQQTFPYLFTIHAYYLLYCFYLFVRHYKKLQLHQKIQFYSIILYALTAVHDILVVQLLLNKPLFNQIAIVIYAIIQLTVVTNKYRNNYLKVQALNKEVIQLNKCLEAKVEMRTKELEIANERLEKLANYDALTNIYNRHVFNNMLQQKFDELDASKQLTLIMIDLDNFKQYNDHYGHHAGDVLIQKIVQTIQQQLPPSAIFARYGGEEFGVIIDDPSIDIFKLGNQFVKSVEAKKFPHVFCENGYATISAGSFTIGHEHELCEPEDLLRAADQQLYRSKNNGKNQFHYMNDLQYI